jgi:hypothetical protein
MMAPVTSSLSVAPGSGASGHADQATSSLAVVFDDFAFALDELLG